MVVVFVIYLFLKLKGLRIFTGKPYCLMVLCAATLHQEGAAGCGGSRQAGSGMAGMKCSAEVMAVRRWFQSLMVRGKNELNGTG